jgi:cell division protease FtsH
MKSQLKNILIFVGALVALAVLFSTINLGAPKPAKVDLVTVAQQISKEEVKSVSIRDTQLTIILKDGDKKEVAVKEANESFTTLAKNLGVSDDKLQKIQITVEEGSAFANWLGILIPIMLPMLVIAVVIFLMMRQVQGQNSRAMTFGQSGAREFGKDDKNRITFEAVAGVKEAKEELMEVVEFLKQPKKFVALGAKIPKGVLLMGPPGTGKTLLARAVAGEANVPFLHISGSEFVEMFVGVGAARVRDLFARAKKGAPCIIFIDEIDAVGRQRGAGLGGSHDEREQTLNQILVEMDGFDPSIGVIVMAATNRPDVLDPALLRPGRFDRRVVLDLPDIADREMILGIHSVGKPFDSDVKLRRLAERTPGFSGADLANMINEGAIFAARQNKKTISMDDLLSSIEKVMLGPERKSRVISEKERKIIAYHEAGHALVFHELANADPVQKISIISRGHAGGYTLKMPTEDRRLHSKASFLDDISGSLGGYVSEIEVFGNDMLTTGASSDLRQATKLARRVVTEYGMSELGPRTFGEKEELIFLGREISEQRDYSEKIAEQIDNEVGRIMNEAKVRAEAIIRTHRKTLEAIVETLLKKETIEREEFEAFFKKHPHDVGENKKHGAGGSLSPAPAV